MADTSKDELLLDGGITASQLHRAEDVDVDVVDLRAQADASMPASNNNVKLYNISNF